MTSLVVTEASETEAQKVDTFAGNVMLIEVVQKGLNAIIAEEIAAGNLSPTFSQIDLDADDTLAYQIISASGLTNKLSASQADTWVLHFESNDSDPA